MTNLSRTHSVLLTAVIGGAMMCSLNTCAAQEAKTAAAIPLREADARLGQLDGELQELAARGTRTALFITADHGRADTFNDHGSKFPESARVWLVATGSAVQNGGFMNAPSARHLADLAPTVRAIAGLPADRDRAAGTPLLELLRSH